MMRIFLSRWLQTLLGTVLLASVVWMFGPLLPVLEPWLPRMVVIQGMLVVWALANALIDWRRRMRDATLFAGLIAAEPGQEARAVADTLGKALAMLKKDGTGAALVDLPWYAIIGPPGAGKTTALLNAGLTFTLAEQIGKAAIAGVGGTRLCEWWFTKDAVLIDTAGRYTTQDSNASVDRAGWDAFLGLLKRTRPRQPLNGVIVAIALPDIVQSTVGERDAHAAAIRQRVAELEQRLGVRIPVYALFTKADLIAGFGEFFDTLDRDQRDQVWGETFPLAEAPAVPLGERFGATLREMVARLNARLLPRLQAEHRLDRRGAIVGFPTQVSSLEKPLAVFLEAAFPASTLLRGVYFASGTQEGTPIDRLTGAMARVFGIDQAARTPQRPEPGRSYFLGQLLRDVVFGEAMLVREAPGAARRLVTLRAAAFATLLLAVLVTAGFMIVSDRAGQSQVTALSEGLAQYENAAQGIAIDPVSDGDVRPMAGLLDQAKALRSLSSDAAAGFGMNQDAKLQAAARTVYRNGLIYGLLPRLVWRLETQMRGSIARPDALYSATRIYLMLGGLGPLNASKIKDWMRADWAQVYDGPDNADLRASLVSHLDGLLAEPLPVITLDTALVTQARASFSRVPLADRVYASIRLSAASTALSPWRPLDVLGPAGAEVFTRASGKPMTDGIPGLFTASGFRDVLMPSVIPATRTVAAETWVIGRREEFPAAELQDLANGVTALYVADFIQRWDAMLSDLNIGPMTSLPRAAQALYIVASPESSVRAVLKSIASAVELAPAGAQVSQHYHGLIDLMSGDGVAVSRALNLVADIQQQLAKIAALPVGAPIPGGGDDIANGLMAAALRQPQPLARWLTTISVNAQALRTGNARQQATISFNAPGGPAQACQAAIGNHYPFVAGGTSLPLGDFSRVFAPGGLLDGFFNTQVKPFVDVSGKVWKPLSSGAGQSPVLASDVAQFQRAATIRDAFFPAGAGNPSVQFEITPAGSPTHLARLTIAGVAIESGNGPAHAAQVTWPGQEAVETASLVADPAPTILESGPWAMFRLLGRGRLQASARPGRQVVTFGSGASATAYDMGSQTLVNPFTTGLLTDFRCPAVQ